MNLSCFYCFDDVGEGMAPIRMVPNNEPDKKAVPMIVPGGSVCLYSVFTRHAASDFRVSTGHRPAMWVGLHVRIVLGMGAGPSPIKVVPPLQGWAVLSPKPLRVSSSCWVFLLLEMHFGPKNFSRACQNDTLVSALSHILLRWKTIMTEEGLETLWCFLGEFYPALLWSYP